MSGYRPNYTAEEENKILDMIIRMEAYYQIKTKTFWLDMEECGFFMRTWQSLKERTTKVIIPDIFNAKYTIPDIEKKKIFLAHTQLG